jgi:hypothetical protein
MPDSEHLTTIGAVVHESVQPEDAYQHYLCQAAPAG